MDVFAENSSTVSFPRPDSDYASACGYVDINLADAGGEVFTGNDFPNFAKGEDGKYHIHHVNNGEGQWDSSDTPYEVSCMHMIFPLAIRASEILGVNAQMRPVWQDIIYNLVPVPQRSRCSGDEGGGGFGGIRLRRPGHHRPTGP